MLYLTELLIELMGWLTVAAVTQSHSSVVKSLERSMCLGWLPYEPIGYREDKKRNQ